MIEKYNIKLFGIMLLLVILGLQACVPSTDIQPGAGSDNAAPEDIPTWTPRPKDQSAQQTATKSAPVSATQTAPLVNTNTPAPTQAASRVTFTVSGGNLNVRRGPSLAYNYVDVLYDGETAIVIGRDRISRWLKIELPSRPNIAGWVTTETEYSTVEGDVSSLPFLKVEPAEPAFIRNCTKHKLWILPAYVQLLPKADAPDNEERFDVRVYEVYDLDVPGTVRLDDVSLTEGRRVDIIFDGLGEKSKCE